MQLHMKGSVTHCAWQESPSLPILSNTRRTNFWRETWWVNDGLIPSALRWAGQPLMQLLWRARTTVQCCWTFFAQWVTSMRRPSPSLIVAISKMSTCMRYSFKPASQIRILLPLSEMLATHTNTLWYFSMICWGDIRDGESPINSTRRPTISRIAISSAK